MRKLLIAGVAVVLIGALSASAAAWFAWQSLNSPLNAADGETINIAPGTPLASVVTELAERGVIPSPLLVSAYARWSGDATRIHAGEYSLTGELTPLTMLDKFRQGDVVMHTLTIVEGWRYDELVAYLNAHPIIAEPVPGGDVMAALDREGLHPEGQFLPDTYLFPRGTTAIAVLARAHEALQGILDDAWAGRDEDIELDSPYEALILASIIEKETALESERPLISGVFNERLKRGMRLQTDPTVIYGLGADFDGNLRRRDLNTDTPYNTYTRHGLPPTPIALPGAAAIVAAVKPESSGALYFVATGEPDGSHAFSQTIEEHNAAVRDYLRRRRER